MQGYTLNALFLRDDQQEATEKLQALLLEFSEFKKNIAEFTRIEEILQELEPLIIQVADPKNFDAVYNNILRLFK